MNRRTDKKNIPVEKKKKRKTTKEANRDDSSNMVELLKRSENERELFK